MQCFNKCTKENAGIFSQPQGWLILAESKLGHGNRAYQYWTEAAPATYNDNAEHRVLEPYVYGQFVEGKDSPFAGRAHVHWLTGTASTVMVGTTEGILGLNPETKGLVIDPSIPSEWKEYTMEKTFRGKKLHVTVKNPNGSEHGVKTSDASRATMDDISNLMIDAAGQKVPLSYVADIRSVTGPNTINRKNVQRKIVISANVSERDLRSVVNEIQDRVEANIRLPEGYHIEYGGQFESEAAASRTLLLTSLMSLLVIFMLLYNEFKDVKESGVILLNLPLALIGGVIILWLTSGEISIPAIIGFISLFGIATRNGMLLISHYTHLRGEGMGLRESVIQGSLDRLNPILMTALSSALALIPLALNGDLPGNEIQSPMATVILGGLLTSTFLNGFIIPIVYLIMNKNKE